MNTETIFALSTAAGKSAVAVFRISGPLAKQTLSQLIQGNLPAPRVASLRKIYDPASKLSQIDSALVMLFEGPKTFTGEDLVEIQGHGSPAIINKLAQILSHMDGLRPALPGEFSRRAFDNGKLDLIEVEGLGDLIHAETEAQRRQAMGLASGQLSGLYLGWRADLIHLLAHQEALIDFPEDDLPPEVEAKRQQKTQELVTRIRDECDATRLKQAIRDGIRIVIVGAPNAGKSTLLNALARREAAIVTDIEGTTRDLIEVEMDFSGFPVIFTDTAGIRHTEDKVEAIGVDRAKSAAEEASILIELRDLSQKTSPELVLERAPDLIIGTKTDLPQQNVSRETFDLLISLKEKVDLDALETRLTTLIEQRFANLLESPSHTRARHAHELASVLSGLEQAMEEELPELAGESLRTSIAAIDRLVGRSDVEDVLDVLFSDFCIGK